MIVCFSVWVSMPGPATTLALRDQEKFDHVGSSADYLSN